MKEEGGVLRRLNAAPGQPHSYSSAGGGAGPGDVYAGRAIFA
jgi:hypothetical protein